MPLPISSQKANSIQPTQITSARVQRKITEEEKWNQYWKQPVSVKNLSENILRRFFNQWGAKKLEQVISTYFSQPIPHTAYLTYPGPEYFPAKFHKELENVDLIDISSTLLKYLLQAQSPPSTTVNTRYIKECLPYTRLKENSYDLLLATDQIASTPAPLRAVLVSEYARILKKNGLIWVTSALNPNTEAPAHFLLELLSSQLEPLEIYQLSSRATFNMTVFKTLSKQWLHHERHKTSPSMTDQSQLQLFTSADSLCKSNKYIPRFLRSALYWGLTEMQLKSTSADTRYSKNRIIYSEKKGTFEHLCECKKPEHIAILLRKRTFA